ncbi:unnamed protein product [Acanthoscelides obtectus]|uniref:Uncharacterized protein n=1 Tax=Acanthoscelides obtectus TaxID=200917 RepID=A0A9P0KXY1_ACAOB|nr:unnamed protein product [Acanthoscelides obtectus]CAK1674609.1 hypothetical protein AOBTE_LOCUS29678 [Acanthoscelides obtectus]
MEQRNATEVGTLRQYREVINAEFNLAFHKPKKDQCSLCVAYQLATSPDNQKIQEKYEKHVSNKKAARALKDEDKETAINDKTISAACFDLQKVLVTPQSAVSDFYYKSKLATYNFTIYDMGNHEGYCYVWHEVLMTVAIHRRSGYRSRHSFNIHQLLNTGCGEGYQTGAHRKMEVPTKLQGSAGQQEEPTISKVTAQEGEGILPALREKKPRN